MNFFKWWRYNSLEVTEPLDSTLNFPGDSRKINSFTTGQHLRSSQKNRIPLALGEDMTFWSTLKIRIFNTSFYSLRVSLAGLSISWPRGHGLARLVHLKPCQRDGWNNYPLLRIRYFFFPGEVTYEAAIMSLCQVCPPFVNDSEKWRPLFSPCFLSGFPSSGT